MHLSEPPPHYRAAVRTLLRFACAMTIVGLLTGVLFQESSKKLPYGATDTALRLVATRDLALVHGHVLMTAVLIPIAMAAALLIARAVGARELGPRPLAWLTRGYLPLVSLALALMLYKGYHFLLSARFGEVDAGAIHASFFGGVLRLRQVVYGLTHVGMAVSLGVFVVALYRSLGAPGGPPAAAGD